MPGYDLEMLMLKTAKSWGMDPVAFRALSIDDQADMLGFDLFEGTRDAYRDEYRDKRNKAKGQNHGENEFTAMKRTMGLKD